jgi:hypothetical protein
VSAWFVHGCRVCNHRPGIGMLLFLFKSSYDSSASSFWSPAQCARRLAGVTIHFLNKVSPFMMPLSLFLECVGPLGLVSLFIFEQSVTIHDAPLSFS